MTGTAAVAGDTRTAVERSAASDRELLESIERRLALLEARTAWLDQLSAGANVLATVGDTVDELADTAERAGVDLDELVPGLRDLALRVTIAAQQSADAPMAPGGIFGLLGQLRDPEIRRALGTLLEFARQFGRAHHVSGLALPPQGPQVPR